MRTEPWPAPRIATSAGVPRGEPIEYVLDSGRIDIELKTKKGRITGQLDRLTSTLTFDPVHVERTRGSVRADLLDLELSAGARDEADPSLLARAFRWLEIDASRPEEDRERDRWAEVRVVGFEPPSERAGSNRRRASRVSAFAEVTLHRFRVPLTLDLEVELLSDTDAGISRLRARTRRPFVVSLAAHDILPRDATGQVTLSERSGQALDFPREARVSAELTWRPAPDESAP